MQFRSLLLCPFVVAVVFTAVATAAPPAPIADAWLRKSDHHDGTFALDVSWSVPSDTSITRYKVYARVGNDEFEEQISISAPENDRTILDYSFGTFSARGIYQVYVTASNRDGESEPSAILSLDVLNPSLYFTNHQHRTDSALAGSEFVYDFDVASDDSSVVSQFVIQSMPPETDATIDSTNGVFRFTPRSVGRFTFRVVAWLPSYPDVTASLSFTVDAADPDQIRFAGSWRGATVDTGETVRTTLTATGSSSLPISYRIVALTDSSSITVAFNETTGELAMTPHEYRDYSFTVGAFVGSENKPRVTRDCMIAAVPSGEDGVYVHGTVLDSNGGPAWSRVIAFRRVEGGTIPYMAYDSVRTALHELEMRVASHQRYIFYAQPDELLGQTPGYYRRDRSVALTWDSATVVEVGSETPDSVNIVVGLTDIETGSNRLSGDVETSAGRAGLREDGRSLGSAAVPLEGAMVYALKEGTVRGLDITDAAGHYEIEGLRVGTYDIVVDKVGYVNPGGRYTFTDDNGAAGEVGVQAEPASFSGVALDLVQVEQAVVQPSPAHDRATVVFTGVAGRAKMSIVDGAGRLVRSVALTTTSGRNEVSLETFGIEPGNYIVHVAMPNAIATAQLVIVR